MNNLRYQEREEENSKLNVFTIIQTVKFSIMNIHRRSMEKKTFMSPLSKQTKLLGKSLGERKTHKKD
jgi:hypothetical protein